MKQELIDYIEERLLHADRLRSKILTESFENQAFGAVEFYYKTHNKTNPQDCAEIVERWNKDWGIKFFELKINN